MFKLVKRFLFGDEEEIEVEMTDLEVAYDLLATSLKEELEKPYDKQDPEKIQSIIWRMKEIRPLIDLEEPKVEQEEKKPKVSGDTLAKIGAAGALAYAGYRMETAGHILPKAFQPGNLATILKL